MKYRHYAAAILLIVAACSPKEAKDAASDAAGKVADATSNVVENVQEKLDIAAPVGPRPSREEMERERFNEQWQKLESFRKAAASRQAQGQQPIAAGAGGPVFQLVQGADFGETMKGVSPAAIDRAPVRVPIRGDVEGPSVLRTQVLLDRNNFSVGAIDGRWGKNSAIAVYWFQRSRGLNPTGVVDEATYRMLAQGSGAIPLVREYQVTADDLKGPFTRIPDDVYEQEKLDCLCYENGLEALAEKFHATVELLQALNPGLKGLTAGRKLWVPNVREPRPENAADDVQQVIVSVKGNYLHGIGANNAIVFHAPTTVGSEYDPSPNETLKLVKIAHDPYFHYQPTLFYEVPDTDPEANLKPGPNSPVGVVWMALSKKHFGIHGTSDPDSIGYASSHGCVRLTNWDARELSHRVAEKIPVVFVDAGRSEAARAVKPRQREGNRR